VRPKTAALRQVAKAAASREQAERRWQQAIIAASTAGHSSRQIAEVAGVSHTRIAEIVKERTDEDQDQ
jgi:hypothetical protein